MEGVTKKKLRQDLGAVGLAVLLDGEEVGEAVAVLVLGLPHLGLALLIAEPLLIAETGVFFFGGRRFAPWGARLLGDAACLVSFEPGHHALNLLHLERQLMVLIPRSENGAELGGERAALP